MANAKIQLPDRLITNDPLTSEQDLSEEDSKQEKAPAALTSRHFPCPIQCNCGRSFRNFFLPIPFRLRPPSSNRAASGTERKWIVRCCYDPKKR
jgi:hypothetical protein